jgi:hypothetical protein
MPIIITGCGGHNSQPGGYGKLRPSTKLAALSLHQDLMLIDFDRISLPQYPKTYDIAPGNYVFELIYYDTGAVNSEVSISTGQVTTLSLTVVPGKLYYIYPSFPSDNEWQPEVHEFVRPDDLSTYADDFWADLEKGLGIEEIMAKHFQEK